MIFILLSWIIIFACLAGLGTLFARHVLRAGMVGGEPLPDLFRVFWLGLGVTIAFTQIYSIIWPVNSTCLLLLGALSVPGIYWLWCGLARPSALGDAWRPFRIARAAAFVFLGGYLVACAASHTATIELGGAYDTELYHFSVIRWTNEYPVVPGLGNLHGRLAMNSSFLLFASLIDNAWWNLRSAWLVNGFLVAVAVLNWLHVLLMSDSTSTPHQARWFAWIALPFLVGAVALVEPSLYYDKPALLLQYIMILEMLRWRSGDSTCKEVGVTTGRAFRHHLSATVTVVLGVLAFTCKPLGLVSMLAAFAFCFRVGIVCAKEPGAVHRLRYYLNVGLLPALLLAGYLARNVLLSGWLLYPAPIGNCHVAWGMPENPEGGSHAEQMQSVAGQYKVIQAWARWGGAKGYAMSLNDSSASWIPVWWKDNRGAVILLPLGGLAFVLAIVANGVRRRFQSMQQDIFWLLLAAGNLVFWFLGAPDLRFGEGFFWLWLALGAASALAALPLFLSVRYGFAFAMSLCLCHAACVWPRLRGHPCWWVIGQARANATREQVLKNGQTPACVVMVPKRGDRAGDAPLPCTPYPLDQLHMRVPGKLRHGFYVASPTPDAPTKERSR